MPGTDEWLLSRPNHGREGRNSTFPFSPSVKVFRAPIKRGWWAIEAKLNEVNVF